MKITRLTIHNFKSVDASISLEPTHTVLFGPNDAGKSNLLEAIAEGLAHLTIVGRDIARRPAVFVEDPARSQCSIEAELRLDGLGLEGHPDEVFFRQAVLAREVMVSPDHDFWSEAHADWDEKLTLSGPSYFDDIDKPFSIPFADEVVEISGASVDSELIKRTLVDQLTASFVRQVGDDRLAAAFATVVKYCAASRTFDVTGERFLLITRWLSPSVTPPREVVRAARLLADCGSDLFAVRPLPPPETNRSAALDFGAAAAALAAGVSTPTAFYWAYTEQFMVDLWDVVSLTEGPALVPDLERRVGEFIRRARSASVGFASGAEQWFEESGDGSFRFHPGVVEACDRLSRDATVLAPAFVKSRYEIVIRPTSPIEWFAGEARRVTVEVKERRRGQVFDLRVVARGIAVWVANVLVEAIRRASVDFDPPSQEFGFTLQSDAQAEVISSLWPRVDRRHRTTLYILDEPERHLHPLAQREVADWLLREIGDTGHAATIMATHSPEFLRLRTEDVQYGLVRRTDAGETVMVPVTHDVPGELRRHGERSGMSPAEVVQLTQAFLIVEGEQDAQVIEHFYGDMLDRLRVRLLRLRGYREALSLAELQFIGDLGAPVFLLLDNVKRRWIEESDATPPSKEAKMVDDIRRAWRNAGAFHPLPFPAPDIFCAVPFATFAAAAQEEFGASKPRSDAWGDVQAEHERSETKSNLKNFALTQLGLKGTSPDEVLAAALRRCPRAEPSPILRHAMESLAATLVNQRA